LTRVDQRSAIGVIGRVPGPDLDVAELLAQVGGILEAAVEAHAADRIVDVRGIAGEQHTARAKRGGNALMRDIEIAVHDLVGLR